MDAPQICVGDTVPVKLAPDSNDGMSALWVVGVGHNGVLEGFMLDQNGGMPVLKSEVRWHKDPAWDDPERRFGLDSRPEDVGAWYPPPMLARLEKLTEKLDAVAKDVAELKRKK